MIRISKDPEERKQELIDTAGRLFMSKGYERTAVSDIVKEIGVAQGTFYYHFKSKTEVLEAVVEKSIIYMLDNIRKAVDGETDPAAKLNTFQNMLNNAGVINKDLSNIIHNESNLVLHAKLAKVTISGLTPILTGIIEDGVSKGLFNVKFPEETAIYMIHAFSMFHERSVIQDIEHIERARQAVEQCVSRILDLKEGTYKLDFSVFYENPF